MISDHNQIGPNEIQSAQLVFIRIQEAVMTRTHKELYGLTLYKHISAIEVDAVHQ